MTVAPLPRSTRAASAWRSVAQAALAALLLAQGGCLAPRATEQEVVEARCDEGELRITERVEKRPFPIGGHRFDLALWARVPAGSGPWRFVDRASKRTPVYTRTYPAAWRYTRLLPELPPLPVWLGEAERARIALHERAPFPTGWTWREVHHWDVFVDPERFDAREYDAIRACLAVSLRRIDAELTARRPPDAEKVHAHRYLPIASIAHARYDYDPVRCAAHSVGESYACGDAVRLQLTPPNLVRLERGDACAVVGLVTDDQEHVLLRPPRERAFAALAPGDWLAFYRSCRAADGSGLQRHFTLRPWEPGAP